MNVIEYVNRSNSKRIAYCMVDRTSLAVDTYSKEIVKNISDFTISLIYRHGYDVFVSLSEDSVLRHVANIGYDHALVISTGNEIENGRSFFNEVEGLSRSQYFIYGHILDRGDAYYELHHQCYLINLKKYNLLECPDIGEPQFGTKFTALCPERSIENIHDDYTPTIVKPGMIEKQYQHKLHGHNIITEGLDTGFSIHAFDNSIRRHKRYYYPENREVFYDNLSYAYSKQNYCLTKFVHESATDVLPVAKKYDQIITVANGDEWFMNHLNEGGNIIIYDYNSTAIEHHKKSLSKHSNIEFIELDVLGCDDINQLMKYRNKSTVINLTNVFTYEGTSSFLPYRYRLEKEKRLLDSIPDHWDVLMTIRAYEPFGNDYDIRKFNAPPWHMNGDWN